MLARSFLQFFQYARQASYVLQPVAGLASDAFYGSSSIFGGFSGRFSSCFGPLDFAFKQVCSRCGPHVFFRQSASLVSSLFYLQRTSPLVLQRGPSPCSSVVFLQRCFPPYFQLRFGSSQLAFLSYRYVEIAAISYLPLWPSRFDSRPSLLSSLLFVKRTSPPVLQRGSSPCFWRCCSGVVSSSPLPALVAKYQLVFLSYRYVEMAAISCPPSPVALALRQSVPTFVAPVWPLSPVFSVVSRVISSSALDATSSLSSVAGTLRLLSFCVYLQLCFRHPRLLLGCLARSIEAFLHPLVWTPLCD